MKVYFTIGRIGQDINHYMSVISHLARCRPTSLSYLIPPPLEMKKKKKKKERKRGPAKTSLNCFWFKAAYAKWYCRVVSSHWNELDIYIFEVILQVVPFLSLILLDNWTEFKCKNWSAKKNVPIFSTCSRCQLIYIWANYGGVQCQRT